MAHGEIIKRAPGQHQRFRIRPYGPRWITYDSKSKQILEFSDDKGLAVQLADILNGQLSTAAAWRERLAND